LTQTGLFGKNRSDALTTHVRNAQELITRLGEKNIMDDMFEKPVRGFRRLKMLLRLRIR